MEAKNAILERRSINFFDANKEMTDSQIKELFELASTSPSSVNIQPWKVVVVKSKERKKKLRECAFNQPKVEEASCVFIMIANTNGVEDNFEKTLANWQTLGYATKESAEQLRGMAKGLYGERGSEQRKIWATKNAGLLGMSIMYSAKALGFDSHPMDGFDSAAIKKNFNIPEDMVIPMLIAVGYKKPDAKTLPRAMRFTFDEVGRIE